MLRDWIPGRTAAALAAAIALGGCAAHQGQSPRPEIARVSVGQVVAGADTPEGWAAAAAARCGALPSDPRGACYEEVLFALLDAHGVRVSMRTLELLPNRAGEMSHHGHMLAHHIGIAGYRGAERVGEAFAECTPAFQSGCYHGIVQAYFADPALTSSPDGLDGARLNALCAEHRGPGGDQWLLFQCLHGMGHGLVALHENHLPRALQGCDLLADLWEREGCYGGAFMENVVSATMPHHAPRADDGAHRGHHHGGEHLAHTPDGGGHDARGGHGHHHGHEHPPAGAAEGEAAHAHHHGHAHPHEHAPESAEGRPGDGHPHGRDRGVTDGPFRALDPADPHYPCSVLEDRYQHGCYSMQTSAVLFWSEGDVTPGIELCEGAPEQVRGTCYVSLGRDINAWVDQDHARAIERCGMVPGEHRASCMVGVARNLIDLNADAGDGAAFCGALPAGEVRARCFRAVGEHLLLLEPVTERRAAFCTELPQEDARSCLPGAGLPPDLARAVPAG
jgi:hypothetical protein